MQGRAFMRTRNYLLHKPSSPGNVQIRSLNLVTIEWVDGLHIYRKISNTRRTQSQNINVSRLVLQLSLPNPLKPGVKLKMEM